MILFFGDPKLKVFAVKITKELSSEDRSEERRVGKECER